VRCVGYSAVSVLSRLRFYNSQGGFDVYLVCPNGGGVSPDGLTCPGLYYVTTDSLPLADCGNNCNKVADPISPSNGNVSHSEIDIPVNGSSPQSVFEHFYNSDDSSFSDMVIGWRHSFSRKIVANVQATPYVPYFYPNPRNSALFSDPGSACNSGWSQVSSTSTRWANTTSTYVNGLCSLSQGGNVVATIAVRNASFLPASVTGSAVSFDATRDDGRDINFMVSGSTIVAPIGVDVKIDPNH